MGSKTEWCHFQVSHLLMSFLSSSSLSSACRLFNMVPMNGNSADDGKWLQLIWYTLNAHLCYPVNTVPQCTKQIIQLSSCTCTLYKISFNMSIPGSALVLSRPTTQHKFELNKLVASLPNTARTCTNISISSYQGNRVSKVLMLNSTHDWSYSRKVFPGN